MADSFKTNDERIAYLVETTGTLAADLRDAVARLAADADPAARVEALKAVLGAAGGLRTLSYNLARIAHDELERATRRRP